MSTETDDETIMQAWFGSPKKTLITIAGFLSIGLVAYTFIGGSFSKGTFSTSYGTDILKDLKLSMGCTAVLSIFDPALGAQFKDVNERISNRSGKEKPFASLQVANEIMGEYLSDEGAMTLAVLGMRYQDRDPEAVKVVDGIRAKCADALPELRKAYAT